MAGELGHMTIDWDGERCICGIIGCLERIASGTAIALEAKKWLATEQGGGLLDFIHTYEVYSNVDQADIYINAEMIAQAAGVGISLACKIIDRTAYGLGIGLVNIIHSFNPERIILGGGVTQMGPLLMDKTLRTVQERTMVDPPECISIVQAQFGADVGIIWSGSFDILSTCPPNLLAPVIE